MKGKKRAVDEEETFQRGGGSGLAPIVKKQLEQVRQSDCICLHALLHMPELCACAAAAHACETGQQRLWNKQGHLQDHCEVWHKVKPPALLALRMSPAWPPACPSMPCQHWNSMSLHI